MRVTRLFVAAWLLALGLSLVASGEERGVVIYKDPAGQKVGLYRNSYALVIGASDYQHWPELPGVKEDVKSVRAALERQGFQVTVVDDPDRAALRRAFEDFINVHGGGVDDRLLFYFAGHGYTQKLSFGGEMGYIVPVDAPLPDTDRQGLLAAALDMEQFQVYATRIQAKHALFLFDSCFSGSVFYLSRGIPEHISERTAWPVREFITSGRADEKVPDRSIFRRELVEGLGGEADTNRDGYVTGIELGEFLKEKVAQYTRGAQHPQSGTILDPRLDKGDFVFLLEGGARPAGGQRQEVTQVTGSGGEAFSGTGKLSAAHDLDRSSRGWSVRDWTTGPPE
jgi:uncharacterized caspase-like protein